MSTSNEDILGRTTSTTSRRSLSITNTDVDEMIHAVKDNADAIFTWDYEKGARPALNKLYEKAKTSQWNGETDLPWDIEVDQEAVVHGQRRRQRRSARGHGPRRGTRFEHWGDEGVDPASASKRRTGRSASSCTASRARCICTAKIVETVPWIDAKYYASTQVMDEARHVEVFAKYLDTKLSGHYPINAHLKMLLDDIVDRQPVGHDLPRHADHGRGPGPRRVRVHPPADHRAAAQAAAALRDERRGPPRGVRRAVAEGVLRRAEPRPRCSERQEFAFEAAVRMRDRFLQQEVWERMGVDAEEDPAARACSPRSVRCSSRCCSPRSCRTARSSACSTPATAGCASGSARSASSSSRTGPTPARSTRPSRSRRVRSTARPPDPRER